MRPENDIELGNAISAIIQSASKLNRLTSEGLLYNVSEVLDEIVKAGERGKQRISQIVDMAG